MLIPLFGQKVTADYDKSKDFSKYKTYSFLGWQKDTDQLVNDFDKETSTTAYTNFYGGTAYRYRRGGYGWANGYATTSYSENDYIKGTLVVDLHDNATQELVWQGVASGTVSENPEKREKKIPKTVNKLMKKYPVDPLK